MPLDPEDLEGINNFQLRPTKGSPIKHDIRRWRCGVLLNNFWLSHLVSLWSLCVRLMLFNLIFTIGNSDSCNSLGGAYSGDLFSSEKSRTNNFHRSVPLDLISQSK